MIMMAQEVGLLLMIMMAREVAVLAHFAGSIGMTRNIF
jgi:hypothetical protein